MKNIYNKVLEFLKNINFLNILNAFIAILILGLILKKIFPEFSNEQAFIYALGLAITEPIYFWFKKKYLDKKNKKQ